MFSFFFASSPSWHSALELSLFSSSRLPIHSPYNFICSRLSTRWKRTLDAALSIQSYSKSRFYCDFVSCIDITCRIRGYLVLCFSFSPCRPFIHIHTAERDEHREMFLIDAHRDCLFVKASKQINHGNWKDDHRSISGLFSVDLTSVKRGAGGSLTVTEIESLSSF